VNSDGSSPPSTVYVADRTAAYESGYAISGATHAAFDPYTEANVTIAAASPALTSCAPAPPPAGPDVAPSQALGAAYWSQAAALLEEENYW